MESLLNGLRVLDFGRYIAGPYCATLLGDLGAEVIRIERLEGGEDRTMMPVLDDGTGSLFLQMGRNKRSLTLDPAAPEGREVVRKLVATADVVVANLPPRVLAALGLDYASLRAVKPDIILVATSAFGPGGPYSERVGFDGIGQAMSGAMHMTGEADTPMRAAVPYVDFGTALYAAFSTMAALLRRRESGQGCEVECSLLGTALSFYDMLLIEQAVKAPNRTATGNRGQVAAPADAFRTRDGWVVVQVAGQPLFEKWARLMGEESPWLTDPRFADDLSRGEHGTEVSARMARWCESRTTAECLAELEAARIPGAPVLTPQQALDDAHIRAAGFLGSSPEPGTPFQQPPVSPIPVRFDGQRLPPAQPAPRLGQHTDEILAEVGFTPEDIQGLRDRGVI